MTAPSKQPGEINLVIISFISTTSLILAFVFWYTIFKYLRLDFSSPINSAHSLSIIYLALGASLIFVVSTLILLVKMGKINSFAKYLPFLNIIIQVTVITYFANFGILYTFNIFSKAAGSCYTVSDIKASHYCLFLLKPPTASIYRVLNPNNTTTTLSSPNTHNGHPCQTDTNMANSINIYNASGDFYGPAASTWQSVHSAIINFTSGLSINSSKVAVDMPLCTSVLVSQTNINNTATLTDTSVEASPSPTPTNLKTGDVNGDGSVNIIDIGIAIDNYNKSPIPNPNADLNTDGIVNIIDIGIIIDNYGK